MKVTGLIGQTFGSLTVVAFIGTLPNKQTVWRARCTCGTEIAVRRSALIDGRKTHCGCLSRREMEVKAQEPTPLANHRRPEYGVWHGMKVRCSPGGHPRYYGRGIRVCRRWTESFAAFFEDMGPRPSPKHSIDRIDNDGDYEPGNCRWATAKEQALNQSTAHHPRHEVMGKLYTLRELSALTGIPHATIKMRLRYGWTIERACSEPVHSLISDWRRDDREDGRSEAALVRREIISESRKRRP